MDAAPQLEVMFIMRLISMRIANIKQGKDIMKFIYLILLVLISACSNVNNNESDLYLANYTKSLNDIAERRQRGEMNNIESKSELIKLQQNTIDKYPGKSIEIINFTLDYINSPLGKIITSESDSEINIRLLKEQAIKNGYVNSDGTVKLDEYLTSIHKQNQWKYEEIKIKKKEFELQQKSLNSKMETNKLEQQLLKMKTKDKLFSSIADLIDCSLDKLDLIKLSHSSWDAFCEDKKYICILDTQLKCKPK